MALPEPLPLEHSSSTIYTHEIDKCRGESCVVHNRSNHVYRELPQFWYSGVMWRLDKQSLLLILDPDEINEIPDYLKGNLIDELILTNKIQCLDCLACIESTTRHHYISCPCGSVSADGGKSYLRRGWDTTGKGYQDISDVLENVRVLRV